MKDCVYIINNKAYTYEGLIKTLSESNIEESLAMLFSLNPNTLSSTYDTLLDLNKEVSFKDSDSVIDGESDLDVNLNTYYTTQTLIDSRHFTINGEPPMFRLNPKEYLETISELMLAQGIGQEEIDAYCANVEKNWNTIAVNNSLLHKILVSSDSNSDDNHYYTISQNTAFSSIYDQLGPAVQQIEKDIWKKNKHSMLIKNLNLEANIRGIAEKILGHIDYLFIKLNGDIEIFNIKGSITNESDWGAVKKEKYRYQLALLKRILEFNGIDTRHIRVNLVPVKLKYDETFTSVDEIIVLKSVSYDSKDSAYVLQKYDNIAALFIASNTKVMDIDDSIFDEVNKQLGIIFTGRDINIQADGIKESAKGWIKTNWNQIAKRSEEGLGWDITLPDSDDIIHISDTNIGEENEELVLIIKSKEELLFKNTAREKATYRVVADIKKCYNDNFDAFYCTLQNSSFIQNQLNKYFEKTPDGDYKWELVDNSTLSNANMLVFRHKETDQLDVINITPFDVSKTSKVKHRDNLLGAYLPDLNSENFTLEANYGNIEAIKAMTLINAVLPKLNFQPKLGTLKVVGISNYHTKKGCDYDLSQLLPSFNTVVKVINKESKNLNMHNNFKDLGVKSVDPSELFILTWKESLIAHPDNTDLKGLEDDIIHKVKTDGTIIDGLESAATIEARINKLELILEKIEKLEKLPKDPKKIHDLIYSANPELSVLAKVYTNALRALNIYNGDLALTNEDFSQASEYFLKMQSIPNTNVRTVGYMFLRTADVIADRMMNEYSPIKEIIFKFMKAKGYGSVRNSLIGDEVNIYQNLYEEENGVKTMRFKNPYNNSNNLLPEEREFLKSILYELNKVRFSMRGLEWKFTGINDKTLIDYINNKKNNYLDVPLERASNATRRVNMKLGFKEFKDRWTKRILHPKEAFNEFNDDLLNAEELELRNMDISNLQAYNPFTRSEDPNRRANFIAKKGVDFFETNVLNLVIDFMEKHIQLVEYSKMLTRTKGILLDLYLKGDAEDNIQSIEHTVKTINDFLSVNVFNRSIMEEGSLKIEAILDPIRKAVSKCYIALNPTALVRDTIEGLLQNTVKALTKFLTDIDVKDVMFGYKAVISEGPQNLMTISKLNLLNLKYRLSNLDIARISEGQKTGRGGIFNAENWAYYTLRAPDYLNRIVLLSARMHHDGCFEAYKIKNGVLTYDFKEDKRFYAYTHNDTSDMKKYNELRSLYLSLLNMFSLETGKTYKEGDPLPDAYTEAQITMFKTFADNIYGSYNKSTRAKYENTAIGRNFAVFSTWMNGIVDVYTKKRLISKSESKLEQETNSAGLLLYFDEYGNLTTLEEKGLTEPPESYSKVLKYVPVMVLGCLYTLNDVRKHIAAGGTWEEFKTDIWTNDMLRRNFNRMGTDLLIAGLLSALFAMFINPAYKEHKREADGKEVISNGIIEVLYKASSNSFDGFKGPFSVIDYIGDSTNPATYSLTSKVLNDVWSLVIGDGNFTDVLMHSLALPRAFLDSYKMWVRDTQNTK